MSRIIRFVTAVKSPSTVKHQEGEISEAPISELLSRNLKQFENSLQYPYFGHVSRSRLELGECQQAGCLQGGEEKFEHGGEPYSLNNLLREAEDGLVDAVNPFAEWAKYTTAVSMLICDYHDHVICCILEVWSVRVLPCSAVFGVCGPVWSSRQETHQENLRTHIHRDGTNDEEYQQYSQWSQCSELKWEYNPSEIDWYWG